MIIALEVLKRKGGWEGEETLFRTRKKSYKKQQTRKGEYGDIVRALYQIDIYELSFFYKYGRFNYAYNNKTIQSKRKIGWFLNIGGRNGSYWGVFLLVD